MDFTVEKTPKVQEVIDTPARVSRRVYEVWKESIKKEAEAVGDPRSYIDWFDQVRRKLSPEEQVELSRFSEAKRMVKNYEPEIVDGDMENEVSGEFDSRKFMREENPVQRNATNDPHNVESGNIPKLVPEGQKSSVSGIINRVRNLL